MRTHPTLSRWGLLVLLVTASPAWGQVEINQTTALAGNVTPGDAAGFPVTLSVGGSYKLTGNLSVPDADTTAVLITADYVTLDLNGFSLRGKTVCTGSPVTSCSPTGTGVGIEASNRSGIVVRNGQIFGMGSAGIRIGPYGRIEQVIVQSNGVFGLVTDVGALVSGCVIVRNYAYGILTNTDNILVGNTIRENGEGLYADLGAIVSGNTASLNRRHGITSPLFDVVSGNTANANTIDGIDATVGGTVTGNTASGNTSAGIFMNGGAALGNTARANGSYGLDLDNASGYGHNVLNDNAGGNASAQVPGGKELDGNVCGGRPTCP